MIKSCNEVQEGMAWGKDLTEAEQSHLLSCSSCNQAATEFAKLDAAMRDNLLDAVPEGFAGRVMNQIAEDALPRRDWASALSERIALLMSLRPVQLCLVLLGALFTCGNLLRFVFAVILPVTA